LRHTKAQTGQLFFLYSDPRLALDAILDEAARSTPLAEVTDEYDVVHRVWGIWDRDRTAEISRLMGDKKLLIADGHHRYETTLAYSQENPEMAGARRVMMTLVNMDSTGLKILATHRLVAGLEGFDEESMLEKAGRHFRIAAVDSVEAVRSGLAVADPALIRIGIVTGGGKRLFLLEKDRGDSEIDVALLHDVLLGEVLGIDAEAVREEKFTRYIRGVDQAVEEVRLGRAQVAFLLEPASVKQVADISFSGRVMPQKSTDFYPKLLSGLTVYKMDE
jgi:uncharacterized protein (DUF1015 family)